MLIFSIILSPLIFAYNYYELSVQKWESDNYKIHGLWPQNNTTSYPHNCLPVNFSSPTDELYKEMNNNWSSCSNLNTSCSNLNLWKHEWVKHGSCVKKQNGYNEFDYFKKTIELFNDYNYLTSHCNESQCLLGCFTLNYTLFSCK